MNLAAANTSTSSTSGTGTSLTKSTSSTKSLGKDEFLKLLVTQLKNQNPLNPMDSSAFVAQLAQFSSLEQLTNTNSKLDSLLTYQNSLQNTLLSNLIGKKVTFSGSSVNLSGSTAAINYNLSGDAKDVKISISDSSGKVVRELDLGTLTSGDKTYSWDGKDANGNTLSDGQYTIAMTATDASGNSVDVTTKAQGTVTGITYDGTNTYLVVDGTTKIKVGDLKAINDASSSSSKAAKA